MNSSVADRGRDHPAGCPAHPLGAGPAGGGRALQFAERVQRVVAPEPMGPELIAGAERLTGQAAEAAAVDQHLGVAAEVDEVPAGGGIDETRAELVQEVVAELGRVGSGRDAPQGRPGGPPGEPSEQARTTAQGTARAGTGSRPRSVSVRISILALERRQRPARAGDDLGQRAGPDRRSRSADRPADPASAIESVRPGAAAARRRRGRGRRRCRARRWRPSAP